LQYSKSRDLKPSRPKPRLAKMGLETPSLVAVVLGGSCPRWRLSGWQLS